MIKTFESTREAFGETLVKLARKDKDIVAVAADTSKSMLTTLLEKEFPDRAIEVGIAEQNMMLVAAGLASCGKKVFATSYSVFTSMRAIEQFRTFIAYPGLNVKVIAGLGGFSAGIEGVTHLGLEDLGIIRCIPGVTLITAADSITASRAITGLSKMVGPAYLRIGRDPSPVVFSEEDEFEIGKARVVLDFGNDIVIFANGAVLHTAIEAAERLKKDGILVKIVEVHTLKPLDEEGIIRYAKECKSILTVEEHNIIGGLYSAVSELLSNKYPKRIEFIAVKDEFTESGLPDRLREKYGLSVSNIVEKSKSIYQKGM